MTFSSSSSISRAVWSLAVAVLAGLLAACRHVPAPPPPLKLALFQVQNATGGNAPARPLTEAVDAELAARGLPVVSRQDLDLALSRHRMRFTGGVDRPMAKVLRDELGVDAVLVPTLETYAAEAPPKVAMAVRLVSTGERPAVLWASAVARSGDDAPGVLGIGRVTKPADLEKNVVGRLVRSVEGYVRTRSSGESCGEAGRFGPRRTFRAPVLDDAGRRSIVVLPFTNETSRRGAGDVILGQFVAQLARSGSFEVLDPGVAREELLAHRIVLAGGVSVDNARVILKDLNADLVLSGYVQVYEARSGREGPPKVEFTAYVLDGRTGELVWSSASDGEGNAGVWFFGAGRVHTTGALSCRMVRGVVDGIVGRRGPAGSSG